MHKRMQEESAQAKSQPCPMEEEEEGFHKGHEFLLLLGCKLGVSMMLEEASLQPWFISSI